MKKTIKRTLSLCVLAVLCMAVALTASAAGGTRPAGAYGKLRAECIQNTANQYILNASTSVTRNNNGACLEMHLDIWELGGTTALHTFTSEPGDLLLAHDIPLYTAIDFEPERVHSSHYVIDPQTGNHLYEVEICEVFSFSN